MVGGSYGSERVEAERGNRNWKNLEIAIFAVFLFVRPPEEAENLISQEDFCAATTAQRSKEPKNNSSHLWPIAFH